MDYVLHRHYRVKGLNFRDFWDICSHYQRIQPKFRKILYTAGGFGMNLVENEGDVSTVLNTISKHDEEVRSYVARYYLSNNPEPGDYGNAKIIYLAETYDFLEPGLHFFAGDDDKLMLFEFEDFIYNSYAVDVEEELEFEYGLPCEVLSVVVDMRGFTAFCEQPQIESPYTCAIMTAFYGMVKRGFKRYPPELVKFLGDGVLAIWQTNSRDREVAIEVCVEGISGFPAQWFSLTRGPEFSHGVPLGIGSGVSFGLASKISVYKDYLGRPINLSARLCSVCPASKTYIDRSVPGAATLGMRPTSVRLKSFGDRTVWVIDNEKKDG